MSPCAFKFSLAPFFRSVQIQSESVKRKNAADSHCWHSHCCRTFFAPMSHRTAGIRTFDIRTLVSFALLTPSHCWHSHCWLRTGVVRTSVFRTLVAQAISSQKNWVQFSINLLARGEREKEKGRGGGQGGGGEREDLLGLITYRSVSKAKDLKTKTQIPTSREELKSQAVSSWEKPEVPFDGEHIGSIGQRVNFRIHSLPCLYNKNLKKKMRGRK